ncbi:ATP-dependent DNA helicase RecQ [hydrothermal vent metagenome]|uniref:DNA 3'-5' helicase n=1 Tax=hydrothermal vent metagenome TaxID=652676 RepID=A0A1W1BCV9_9ZZZZ
MTKEKALKRYFGFDTFRPLQEEVVDSILGGEDLLMILPTGGGKSLCYQLPALLKEGIMVVISPLIALMQDQIKALQDRGIEAVMLSSAASVEEQNAIYERLYNDKEIKFLYIAPERFGSKRFLELLSHIKIASFVIDEAHCVSEWGHEFRSDYRKLHLLKEHFPYVPITAFTATATPRVADDIIKALRLNNPKVLKAKIFRDNLLLSAAKRVGNGYKQVESFIAEHKNESGIIYTFTRKESERLAAHLQKRGYDALAYHAGLSSDVRSDVYKRFINDETRIIVATVAFGMGIDKSNIRYVVHMSLPKTIESYFQEVGRAGRDTLMSEALLLYSSADEVQKRELIKEIEDETYRNNAYKKLDEIYTFAISSSCRHRYIANYFGDEIKPCKSLCDNCTKEKQEQVDITEPVLMLLSTIYRVGQSFGQNYIIDVARGSKVARIAQNGHESLSVYGVAHNYSKKQLEAVLERLFDLGAIIRAEHKVLRLTHKGVEILKSKEKITIDKDRYATQKIKSIQKEQNSTHESEYDVKLFEQLRELRAKIAKENEIPAYIVFSDKTLKDMSIKKPQTKEEMLEVNGVGEVKFERYGEEFLEVLTQILQ